MILLSDDGRGDYWRGGAMQSEVPNYLTGLERAINRLDFYRIFKSLCVELEVEKLLLLDMNNWPDDNHIESLLVVVNSEERIDLDLDVIQADSDNPVYISLRDTILPEIWDLAEDDSNIGFCSRKYGCGALTLPVHTPHGRHFGFVVVSKSQLLKDMDIGSICLGLHTIFECFYQKIILPVSLPIISPRELEVIKWSSEGKTSVEIAIILGLSEHTINSYTTKILQKLQVVNRAQMVAKALRMGLIQ